MGKDYHIRTNNCNVGYISRIGINSHTRSFPKISANHQYIKQKPDGETCPVFVLYYKEIMPTPTQLRKQGQGCNCVLTFVKVSTQFILSLCNL